MGTSSKKAETPIVFEGSDAIQVGDTIRVLNLENDRMHRGKVVALYPEKNAISVDVTKGRRIYIKDGNVPYPFYLPDMLSNSDDNVNALNENRAELAYLMDGLKS